MRRIFLTARSTEQEPKYGPSRKFNVYWFYQRITKAASNYIRSKDDSILDKEPERRVGFLICGAQKAGTSALHAYLHEHPDICMSRRKELHYFDQDCFFEQPKQDYSYYHKQFAPEPQHKIIGEATPSYMYWRDAPRRISEYNPTIKLIVILRNPIDRAYSHWNMERLRGQEDLSFWDAINREQERCRSDHPKQHRLYSYTDRGFYTVQLNRIFSCFPKNQVLLLKYEDLEYSPTQTLSKICRFLGVGAPTKQSERSVNVLSYKKAMSERERDFLRRLYQSEIAKLERMLDWNCTTWLKD